VVIRKHLVANADLERLWAALVASLSLFLPACHTDGEISQRRQEQSVNTKDNIVFQADFKADASRLLIHYRVQNGQATTVYLLNRVFRSVGPGVTKIHKDFAYVYVDPQRIVVEKAIPAIPPGVSPYEPLAPLVTPVRPGTSFEEVIELSLPIHDTRPYAGSPPSDTPTPVSQVQLIIGYMVSPEGTTERTETIFGEPVILFRAPPGKLPAAGRLEVQKPIVSFGTNKNVEVLAFLPKPTKVPPPP